MLGIAGGLNFFLAFLLVRHFWRIDKAVIFWMSVVPLAFVLSVEVWKRYRYGHPMWGPLTFGQGFPVSKLVSQLCTLVVFFLAF